MILSMTGFGRSVKQWNEKTITVEVKSLNSKSTDLKIRVPQRYREKEMDIRSIVMSKAERGKIELNVDVVSPEGGMDYSINKSLFKYYYKDLQELSTELDMPTGDFITGILRIQGVVDVPKNGMPEEEWNVLKEAIQEAVGHLMDFRATEGAAMEKDFRTRVENISTNLTEIEPFEQERIDKVRLRLTNYLDEQVGKENVDQNRFEQELIYYLEKFDLNEEKVRLRQHCKYFLKQLDNKVVQKGRKLTFIGQEMGREINTIGSKANSSNIQHLVVKMKDELEKIKEQSANVL